jgi:phospholipid-binding lipoprotein MlaA
MALAFAVSGCATTGGDPRDPLETVNRGVLAFNDAADAVNDWLRFAFNTTLGFFGVADVASEAGLEKHNEDLGQTLAHWGVGDGPYLMLPLLGPSTTRDTAALPVDWLADPVLTARPIALRNSLTAVRFVARREELLDATRALEEAALDRYVFLRESYLQRRRNLVYDGQPPRERPPAD